MPPSNLTPEQLARLEAALASLNAERQKEKKLLNELAAAEGKSVETVAAKLDILKEQSEQLQQSAKIFAEMRLTAGGDIEIMKQQAALRLAELEKIGEKNALSQEEIRLRERLTEIINAEAEETAELVKNMHELTAAQAEDLKQMEELTERSSNLGGGFAKLSGDTLGLGRNMGGFSGTLAKSITQGVNMGDTLGSMAAGFKNLLNPTKIVENIIANTFARLLEFADAQAELRQVTGAAEEMNDVFMESYETTLLLGQSSAETRDALKALYTGFVGFSALSGQAQADMASFANTLNLFNVDASVTAEAMDFLQMSLQMSDTAAKNTVADMVGLAKALKVPPSIIMKDFNAARNVIGQFGKQGFKVFKQLSAQVKSTGVEMSSLLGIAEGFDTFESAADHVGSLNALLGGAYFDTMQMVSATEAERIELMREGIAASGKSWESMGRFERKAIMAAAGITEITEANKLFGNSLDVYYEQEAAAAVAAGSLTDLTQGAKDAMSMTDKMNAIFNRMMLIMQPLVDAVMGVFDGILEGFEMIEPVFKFVQEIGGALFSILAPVIKLIGKLGVLFLAFKVLGVVIGAVMGPVGLIIGSIVLLYKLFTDGPQFIFDFAESLISGLMKVSIFMLKLPYIILQGIAEGLIWLTEGLIKVFETLPDTIVDFIIGIPDMIANAFEEETGEGSAFFGTFLSVFGKLFKAIFWDLPLATLKLLFVGIPTALFKLAAKLPAALASMGRSIMESLFGDTGTAIADFFGDAMEWAGEFFDFITAPFKWLAGIVESVVEGIGGAIDYLADFNPLDMLGDMASSIGETLNPLNWFAEGGIVSGPQIVGVGEGGPEAIVPLSRLTEFTEVLSPATPDTDMSIASEIMSFANSFFPGGEPDTIPPAKAVGKPAVQPAPKQEVILEVDGYRLGKVVYESFLKGKLEPMLEST